ncbi:MAG: hypothetical protein Q8S21_06325 [Candidatus Paracaedibacteraceae bacterium]|nr:hypothetical protein [Candidatus Paracaedibacteraceae bacterium]
MKLIKICVTKTIGIFILSCCLLFASKETTKKDTNSIYKSATRYKNGTEKNSREYLKCCEKAAKENIDWALNEMGVINEFGITHDGKTIVLKDIDKALKYYQAAADLGLKIAQENVLRISKIKQINEQFMQEFEKQEFSNIPTASKNEKGKSEEMNLKNEEKKSSGKKATSNKKEKSAEIAGH